MEIIRKSDERGFETSADTAYSYEYIESSDETVIYFGDSMLRLFSLEGDVSGEVIHKEFIDRFLIVGGYTMVDSDVEGVTSIGTVEGVDTKDSAEDHF